MAAADGVKSPKILKALNKAVSRSGLPVAEIGRRMDGRANIQRRLRGDVGVTTKWAVRFEEALGLPRGSIANLVDAELIAAREKILVETIRENQAELRQLQQRRKRLSGSG